MNRLLRRLRGRVGRLLSLDGFSAAVEVLSAPQRVPVTQPAALRLRLTNTGPRAWAAGGPFPVRVGYRWLWSDGRPIDDAQRTPLPARLAPGGRLELDGAVLPPNTAGEYTLAIDLVREGVGWCRSAGARAEVRVQGHRASGADDAFDYLDLYARTDLERDWWTIVGPASREEFESLGRIKLRFLTEHGLTPESRVLDVGCGTGQLAAPLVGYLSDRGRYCGTDIAPEAVAFCR